MQSKKIPRREREKARQRQEMLDAALSLFAEKGYHNVSMHEIAREAEFAIGTLYQFFKNKEDLYRALIREHVEKFHETLTRALEIEGDEIAVLKNYVRLKGEIFCANAPMVRLYFAESHGSSFCIRAGLDAELREKHNQFLRTLASVFEKGMKRRRFRNIAPPSTLAIALDSIIHAHLFLWLESPERNPYPENPDTILNILFKGLLPP